jgi:hypothetical protein
MTVTLDRIDAVDWEDITLGDGFIYVADIGDNQARREKISIHRLKEPIYSKTDKITIGEFETMNIRYAGGPRDAETLMWDKNTKELIIISKRENNCNVYSFPFVTAEQAKMVTSKGTLPLTGFTAGSINTDGAILIKNYHNVFYWEPSEHSAVERIIKGPAHRIEYLQEPQGEAIGWGSGGFYTISEKNKGYDQILYFYRSTKNPT